MSARGSLVAAAAAIASTAGACDKDENCACPDHSANAVITLSCPSSTPPTAVVDGPCTVQAQGSDEEIVVPSAASGATCQVALTFADGATTSVSFGFGEEWQACGSDPHGCGQSLVASPASTTVSGGCADGGPLGD